MKILLIILALLPCLSYAGDCEKLAAFQQNQERKLREAYLVQVPRDQWLDFMWASDRVLQDRYRQRVDICKEELGK